MKIIYLALFAAISLGVHGAAAAKEAWAVVHYYYPQGPSLAKSASCFSVASKPFKISFAGDRPGQTTKIWAMHQFLNHLYEKERTILDQFVTPNNRIHYGSWFFKNTKAEAEAEAAQRYWSTKPANCKGQGKKFNVTMTNFAFRPYTKDGPRNGIGLKKTEFLRDYIQGKK